MGGGLAGAMRAGSVAQFSRPQVGSSLIGSRFYAEDKKKAFERSLPHLNVGTIGHVDHGLFLFFLFKSIWWFKFLFFSFWIFLVVKKHYFLGKLNFFLNRKDNLDRW